MFSFKINWDKNNIFKFEESKNKSFNVWLNNEQIVNDDSKWFTDEIEPKYIFIDFCGSVKDFLGENHYLYEDLYFLNNDYENDSSLEELVRMYIDMLIHRMVEV